MVRGPASHALAHIFLSQFMLSPKKRVWGVCVAVITFPALLSMWEQNIAKVRHPFLWGEGRRRGTLEHGLGGSSLAHRWDGVLCPPVLVLTSCFLSSILHADLHLGSSRTLDLCLFPYFKHVCWMSSSSFAFFLSHRERCVWTGTSLSREAQIQIDRWTERSIGEWVDGQMDKYRQASKHVWPNRQAALSLTAVSQGDPECVGPLRK